MKIIKTQQYRGHEKAIESLMRLLHINKPFLLSSGQPDVIHGRIINSSIQGTVTVTRIAVTDEGITEVTYEIDVYNCYASRVNAALNSGMELCTAAISTMTMENDVYRHDYRKVYSFFIAHRKPKL